MSTPTIAIVPSTTRLDTLVATAVLTKRTPQPVQGTAVIDGFTWPDEVEVEIRKEIISKGPEIRAAIPWANVDIPRNKGVPLRQRSGELTTGPNEIVILLPITSPEAPKQIELETWIQGNDRLKTKLMSGLIVIPPSVVYVMPDHVSFVPYRCHISLS